MALSKLPDEVVVIDCETSIKNRGENAIGSSKASPFYIHNSIVMLGMSTLKLIGNEYRSKYGSVAVYDTKKVHLVFNNAEYLVGCNIKFDLLYLMKSSLINLVDLCVWDVMIVEYLITGQQSKFASLDKLATKYGGTLKDDKIKEYWNNDVDTEDIPEEELKPYLISDVKNTELIFSKQYQKVLEMGLLPLVLAQMDALVATTLMEYNGMHFDMPKAYEQATKIQEKLERIDRQLKLDMVSSGITQANPSSNEHISLYLFGGKYKYISKLPMKDAEGKEVRYKSGAKKGEIRYKNTEIVVDIKGQHDPLLYTVQAKKHGFYEVGEEVLKKLTPNCPFSTQLLIYRSLYKDLNTYYIGYAKHFWHTDDCIHGSIHHCATATGRLSSSKPNLQNLTNKE